MIPYMKVYLKDLIASAEIDQIEYRATLHQILNLHQRLTQTDQ